MSASIQAIVIRGPFTEDDFALLAAAIRQIDERHASEHFEIVAIDPTSTALEVAEDMLKRAIPPLPGHTTTFRTKRRR
jgi:hypothetical protein